MADSGNGQARKLQPEELHWSCPDTCLDFESTRELEPLSGTIGQDRALEALRLGLTLYAPGYNMFVCGLRGTRKLETVQEILQNLQPKSALPPDRAYVHNFDLVDEPWLLTFPRGQARNYARAMDRLVQDLRASLASLQRHESLARRRQDVIRKYEQKGAEMFGPFEEKVQKEGFALVQAAGPQGIHPHLVPSREGNPVNWTDLEQLVAEGKLETGDLEKQRERYGELILEMQQLVTESMRLGRELRSELREMTRDAARGIVDDHIETLRMGWPDEKVGSWLDQVGRAVLEDLELFMAEDGEETHTQGHLHGKFWEQDPFVEYRVKVVLDAASKGECPIIVEQSPTFQNIFGTVEYATIDGSPTTDHTRIKVGDILDADGGYIVLDAYDALSEPGVWVTLKRTLLHQKLQLQPTGLLGMHGVSLRLKPEPIDISTKIILVGDRYLYHMLSAYDEDFERIFKVLVDFEEVVPLTEESVRLLSRFIARIVHEEKLAEFSKCGVKALVDQAVREAEDRQKLTARLNILVDLMREADHHRKSAGDDIVRGEHVQRALDGIRFRHSLMEERLMEATVRDILLVDTEGSRKGVVNGLTVFDLGVYSFGRPTRITATTGPGKGGILNIEREVELSGASHDKGVLILGGYLRERFAQELALAVEASLVFEQSYSEVDGDSASSAECYALLSDLSGLPLRQDIAVTGSVNQKGEIQAIGGVNQKIEGFYRVCKRRGLTGTQGVLIPESNVQHVSLAREVVDAVREGRFHVWSARTIDEGIALLTGTPAGERAEDGTWTKGSVSARVMDRLSEMAEEVKSYGAEDGGEDHAEVEE